MTADDTVTGVAEYVYEVRSDVPLSLVSAAGNVPVLIPSSGGLVPVGRDFRRASSGPQAALAIIAARLVSDGSEADDDR